MIYKLKTKGADHTLTFNMTFLRLVQGYTGKDMQEFLKFSMSSIDSIGKGSMMSLTNLFESMIQITRAGIEATRRVGGDAEPVSEIEAENILNSIGQGATAQMSEWGGILLEMTQSLFPQELGKGDNADPSTQQGGKEKKSLKKSTASRR